MKISTRGKVIVFCSTAFVILTSNFLYAQGRHNESLTLISPSPDTIVVSKTPHISFRFPKLRQNESWIVLLDDSDITALVTNKDDIYSYYPIEPLAAGQHKLYIFGYQTDGRQIEKEYIFSNRQSESFDEIYSNNRLSATVKGVLNRDFSQTGDETYSSTEEFPYASFDSYLTTDSSIKKENWDTTARANLRYYDQNAALTEPEKKGISVLDFLVSANYTGEKYSGIIEIGDTTIDESINTIDYLTRRGGLASFSSGFFTLTGFSVLGEENDYEIDGAGFRFNSNDHIMGTSAELKFFDKQMSIKAIYARGGVDGESIGTWSEVEGQKGDVTGIVVTSDFYNEFFITDFEFDLASFDQDTGDGTDEVSDNAYRVRFSGQKDIYDYDVHYDYTGPEYDVVGNQSIVKDWAGYDFTGGLTLTNHAVKILANYSWDNVEDDDFFARIYSTTWGGEYYYTGWQHFPAILLYEFNAQSSEDEPEGVAETSIDTSKLTGSLSYVEGPWSVEIRSSYSEQNDKTSNNFDKDLYTVEFAPTYVSTYLSFIPTWTLNISKDLLTDVQTDTNTITLDVFSSFLKDTLIGELGGTYDWVEADDDSTDLRNTTHYAKLTYRFEKLWNLEETSIALEYHNQRQEDLVYDSTYKESTITLVLSSVIPYSF